MGARIRSIVVLLHPRQGMSRGAFVRRLATDHWIPEGRRMTGYGGSSPPSADAAILHIDLTHIPEEYTQLAERYPVAVNIRARDISKRRVCTTLVSADDAYDGPVIVKTDRNHRGLPEESLGLNDPSARKPRLPDGDYPIFARKGMVPAWMWQDPDLVVQRLHVQREGALYVLHMWFFLGNRDIVSTYYGTEPVVKLANVVRKAPLHDDVPEAMRRRRAELGFDYGKFDYVIEDGEAVLLDANLTPNNGDQLHNERAGEICAHLAPGIDSIGEWRMGLAQEASALPSIDQPAGAP
jgi:hypothetical protein